MSAVELDSQFQFLDQLPDTLFQTVVTTRHGSLSERVEGIMGWRSILLSGRLPKPDELCWPELSITAVLLPRLDVLELSSLCAGEESLVDHILKDICLAVDSVGEWRERNMEGLFGDTLDHHRRERNTPSELDPQLDDTKAFPETLQDDQSARDNNRTDPGSNSGDSVQTDSMQPASESNGLNQESSEAPAADDKGDAAGIDDSAESMMLSVIPDELGEALEQQWQQLAENWRDTDEIVKGMATKLGRGWDLSQGILTSDGWQAFVKLRHWIKGHPQLVAIVDNLGRDYQVKGDGSVEEVNEVEESDTLQETPLPFEVICAESPMSTQGVSRSDDVARMLPQEAAYLGHRKLHMFWHARRAEKALLSYQVEGVLQEHQPELIEMAEKEQKKRQKSEPKRGPVMVCIDTSASMQGEPEQLAKAISLEVVRLANEQQRDCLLFAFSGPGQLLEERLVFNKSGLKTIIQFLQQSFHGGSDIREPIRHALKRIEQEQWKKADMLLVSDGRFTIPGEIVARIDRERREEGLRIQCISVGRWSSSNMERICQSLYRFESVQPLG